MGTKVHCKSFLPGYYPMRDLNENSNSCSWPPYYGDKTFVNGQYYNGCPPRAATDLYPGHDKDVVKQTMLKHEAIFKKQVHELHRLYRIQRDLMDEFKRKELHKNLMPVETSLSSGPLVTQITSENAQKWHIPSFPPANSVYARPTVSGVEDIHSPLSYVKGNSTQGGLFPSQNEGNSKDLEILDSRPTKVRRKMIDLQLPADEYIDTEEGENLSEEKVLGVSNYHSNRNHKLAPEKGVRLFLGNGEKCGIQGDALTSDSCLESRNGLADLNEPIPVEEASASGHVDLLSQGAFCRETQGPNLSAKPNLQFLSLPKGTLLNSHHGSDNGTRNNWHLENNGNEKGWFCHVLEAGPSKSNLKSASQGLQPEISSQPMQVLLNKAHETSGYYLTDKSKGGSWNERTVCASEISNKSDEISSNKHLGSMVASHLPSPYPIAPSFDLAKSWSHSVSSWEKQSSTLSQKSISGNKQPCLNSSAATLSKSSQSSVQSNGFFGDAWHLKSNSRCNPGFGSDASYRNGFCQGLSSASKELSVHLPSRSYDYMNCVNDHNRAPDHFICNGVAKHPRGSDHTDRKSVKDENLNVVLSNSSSNKVAPRQDFEIIDEGQKHEDHLSGLPWLRPKPSSKNESSNAGRVSNIEEPSFFQSSPSQFSNKSEMEKGNHIFTQNTKSVSCFNDAEVKRIEIDDNLSNRKILGFPIFEKSNISRNESSSFTSPSVSHPLPSEGGEVENNRKNRVLDINLPCEPAVLELGDRTAETPVKDKKTDANISIFRHNIDLNSCISDDEEALVPSSPSTPVKITAGIDLEAPIVQTEEDSIHGDSAEKQHAAPLQLLQHKAENAQDELMVLAAEAIVVISSSGFHNQFDDTTCKPSEASETDLLNWFVEIVSLCGDEIESKFDAILRVKDGEDNEEEGSDSFESMTLKLTETKEEDYMPKPLVPENLKLEETGATSLPNRPRKGLARRGRQRRDFQRDILPGIASLSRHEVTEDLQTFGGLMRATGHSWHSGLTRRSSTRNGCGRGRRRSAASCSPTVPTPACTPLIQQLSNIEVGLEDRSLAGWGKTTRRPRRQRCPAGNHASIPLT